MVDATVMIVGKGAREHALSLSYEKSKQVNRIIVCPGNGFIGNKREKEVIIDNGCSLTDPESILRIALKYKPDFIDVSQDDALRAGTVDILQQHRFRVFGPTQDAARIEWDKRRSKEFMKKYGIPTSDFRYFKAEQPARKYVRELYAHEPGKLLFVKATGLCAGKGTFKTTNLEDAIRNIEMMKTLPDKAGKVFLIEEGLVGEEFSYFAVYDGKTYHLFKSAQDNKTIGNFDEGDQTGGMGTNSPAMVTYPIAGMIKENLIKKALDSLAAESILYKGILFLGGIAVDGKPWAIEFNSRWGDPECQVILPSIQNDYLDIAEACIEERLNDIEIKQDDKTRVCIVGARRGYPEKFTGKRKRIYGIEEAMKTDKITVLGAAIDVEDGNFYAGGGRLINVIAEGDNIIEARQRAYSAIAGIQIPENELYWRIDIGNRDLERYFKEKNP